MAGKALIGPVDAQNPIAHMFFVCRLSSVVRTLSSPTGRRGNIWDFYFLPDFLPASS